MVSFVKIAHAASGADPNTPVPILVKIRYFIRGRSVLLSRIEIILNDLNGIVIMQSAGRTKPNKSMVILYNAAHCIEGNTSLGCYLLKYIILVLAKDRQIKAECQACIYNISHHFSTVIYE